jgi:hypothetical protein
LNGKDCILCLDNFESPRDQDGDTRYAVEEHISSYLTYVHKAKVFYSKALNYHKCSNDALGQENDYEGLGKIYLHLDKL